MHVSVAGISAGIKQNPYDLVMPSAGRPGQRLTSMNVVDKRRIRAALNHRSDQFGMTVYGGMVQSRTSNT